VPRDRVAARLRAALRDADRRVQTEALRTLGMYDDDASFNAVLAALDSDDSWISVSAAEAMARYGVKAPPGGGRGGGTATPATPTARAPAIAPRLRAAAAPGKPAALRITALPILVTIAPEAALDVATTLAQDSAFVARTAGMQALQRLGDAGRAALDRLNADPAFAARQQATSNPPPPAETPRADAEYRAIVERWIVPDYNGVARPRSIWETPKGTIELELYAGDAPLALEYFSRAVESGDIVGTEFGRLVPNFVAQQRTVRNAIRLRDEVTRRGLTRGNLSWASSGLDTGRAGFTLGNTPQPHNEGNFTTLGRVVRGLDVLDRLELGDRIISARLVR
jgi:cyclophilin family peptidyl-prolyl cis-trans isomerase